MGVALLCYHVFPDLDLDYVFESEVLGIRWSARGYPDLLTRHMMFEGLYQEDVLECIRHLAGSGGIVYDVGGHHGLMAVVAARTVGDRGRVVTFEPNPAARRLLEESLRLNAVTNVRVEPIGLHGEEGCLDFYVQEGRSVSWNSSFVKAFADPRGMATRLKVQTLTLDSYVRRSNLAPSLVKIDTEGTEMQILLGATATIERHRPAILVEMNAASAERANTTVGDLVRFLRAHAYELRVLRKLRGGRYRYDQWEPFDGPRHGRAKLVNVACVPS